LQANIAALTTLDRSEWAAIREEHFTIGVNHYALSQVSFHFFSYNQLCFFFLFFIFCFFSSFLFLIMEKIDLIFPSIDRKSDIDFVF
jgi:hypothetical protein